jgi:hypothetical protein
MPDGGIGRGSPPYWPFVSRDPNPLYWYDGEHQSSVLDPSWNVIPHGDARTGKWRGNWRMEWVLFTLPRNIVYPALLPLMPTSWLPVVDWTDASADLNGLVRYAERRDVVSARVPSHFNWPLPADGDTQCLYAPFQFECCSSWYRTFQTPTRIIPWIHRFFICMYWG